ncbi:hypothetical protein EJ08DRAFT_577572 [Tothia fuscella]|uniref:Uncharacterized protein n=1 Tax=Tothia fuscella TaxID=1048955 RepID=A0A9P4U4I9_9PEZI|nr:hypothetical protein EJ08DRAFT_577572 [Tothia fuscella]
MRKQKKFGNLHIRCSSANNGPKSRIERLNSRLPKFLRPYTASLVNAPLSHVTAFLLLHELTAIVPLVGLATTFHCTNYLPSWISDSAYVKEGVEKFGRYFKRKGWFQDGETVNGDAWGVGNASVKVVLEVATAWAITKALLPLRLIGSVWATPWFARVAVVPVTNIMGKILRTGPAKRK